MAMDALRAALDIPTILALAGSRSFERGVEYVAERRVGAVDASDDALEATVIGTEPYDARIALADGQIVGTCSCPMGDLGVFCKHCVALALAWSEPPADQSDLGTAWTDHDDVVGANAAWDDDTVWTYLAELDQESLVGIILEEMRRDASLASRIRLRATGPSADGLRVLRSELDRATTVRGYLEYGDVPAFAAEVGDVADALERSVLDGDADAAIGLAEHGLRRIGSTIEMTDDSDGYLGDLLGRFQDIHFAACAAARPHPVELARRLFEWELHGEWDVFAAAAERYADVLGTTGLAEYRRLAAELWERVPTRGPGDARYRDGFAGSSLEFSLRRMMESLARASGSLDELIAVMSRDLSSAYQYLLLAEVCRDHGRSDEALAWAERGVASFPARTDDRLREFLADAYLERSRDAEAMSLIWSSFEEQPSLEACKRLRRYAERSGTWDAWRTRAVELASRPDGPIDDRGTLLVSIHTWEGEIDAAWAVAQDLGCERRALLKLAIQSEAARPADAVVVFKSEVQAVLAIADRRHYAEAIGLLRRVERTSARLDRAEDFQTYAAEVRSANARRPAFRSMFDAAGFLA